MLDLPDSLETLVKQDQLDNKVRVEQLDPVEQLEELVLLEHVDPMVSQVLQVSREHLVHPDQPVSSDQQVRPVHQEVLVNRELRETEDFRGQTVSRDSQEMQVILDKLEHQGLQG